MRTDQIKFRGKSVTTEKWVYGDLLHIAGGSIIYHGSQTEHSIMEKKGVDIELLHGEVSVVNPDTIGQFTGLKDKNSTEIYEGDIVKVGTNYCSYFYQVIFSTGCYRLADKDGDIWHNLNECDAEVCGNIYDNKDLLED